MGIRNVSCTLEQAESNASFWSNWVPEQMTKFASVVCAIYWFYGKCMSEFRW